MARIPDDELIAAQAALYRAYRALSYAMKAQDAGHWDQIDAARAHINVAATILGGEAILGDAEISKLRLAISGIAPWLSASLSSVELGGLGDDAGPEYRAACDAVFLADAVIGGEAR